MQISNKIGYLIIAAVVILLVGYFWMQQKKKEIPPGSQIGAPARRGEGTGMMGRGADEGVLDEDGGFILHIPR